MAVKLHATAACLDLKAPRFLSDSRVFAIRYWELIHSGVKRTAEIGQRSLKFAILRNCDALDLISIV